MSSYIGSTYPNIVVRYIEGENDLYKDIELENDKYNPELVNDARLGLNTVGEVINE